MLGTNFSDGFSTTRSQVDRFIDFRLSFYCYSSIVRSTYSKAVESIEHNINRCNFEIVDTASLINSETMHLSLDTR